MDKETELHLRDYLHVLRKHWLAAALVFAAAVTVSAVRLARTVPVYMASAQILIDRERLNIISVEEILKDNRDWEYYETQYALLKSRSVAAEAIAYMERAMGIAPPVSAEGKAGVPGSVKGLFGSSGGGAPGPGTVDERSLEQGRISSFIASITIQPVPDTRLVNIKAYDPHPEMAAAKANALAEVFIRQNLQHRLDAYKEAGLWLDEHLAETQQKMEKSALALQQYREDRNIVSLEERRAAIARKIEDLSSQLSEARVRRRELEARHGELTALFEARRTGVPDAVDTAPEVAGSALIQRLEADRTRLEVEMAELLKTFTAKHPKVENLRSQMTALEERIVEEERRIIAAVGQEAEQVRRREEAIPALITEQEAVLRELERESGDYLALEKEVEENRRLYERLKARAKETNLAAGLESNNVRMVDPAEVPRYPVRPNKTRAMGLALLVGVLGGVGLAFFLEYLDHTVKDPDDLERLTGYPLLGMVPTLVPKEKDEQGRDLISLKEPKSLFAEAYRAVRTSVLFAAPDDPPKVLLVTSPGPREGKTVTAVNLAITMAAAGKRILLVDADMRKPRLHRIFGVDSSLGLSNLLGGESDVAKAISQTKVEGLSLITSGVIPPNPSELLGSARMQKLLGLLRGRYDRVIVDCTPLISVTDAAVLANRADGVILVVRAGSTSRQVLSRSRKLLEDVKAAVTGVVLNWVDVKKSSYYYSSYYYHHYYGEDEAKGNGRGRRKSGAGRKPSSPRP